MRISSVALATVLVLGVLLKEAMPQGFNIDNNTLFALGAVVVASGVAYHVGRQSAFNDHNGGRGQSGGFGGFPFLGRKRRQAESPLNELDPLVTELFQVALEKDAKGCSLQLACSIGSRPSSLLTGHAKNLYGVLSDDTKKVENKTKGAWNGLDAYRVALNLGRDGGDCFQLFPNCPNPSEQLMGQFQAMHTTGN